MTHQWRRCESAAALLIGGEYAALRKEGLDKYQFFWSKIRLNFEPIAKCSAKGRLQKCDGSFASWC
jgi:hypothetical protein